MADTNAVVNELASVKNGAAVFASLTGKELAASEFFEAKQTVKTEK